MRYTWIFVENNSNIQNTDSEPFLRLTPDSFTKKIEELKIPDINEKDLHNLS